MWKHLQRSEEELSRRDFSHSTFIIFLNTCTHVQYIRGVLRINKIMHSSQIERIFHCKYNIISQAKHVPIVVYLF